LGEDITEIWEFIAQDDFCTAGRVREDFLRAFRLLATNPRLGHTRQDLTSLPLRFFVVHSFLIAYAPEQNPVLILAVFCGKRSPKAITALLKSRS
jgi:plasmid stabilization system protein ParE